MKCKSVAIANNFNLFLNKMKKKSLFSNKELSSLQIKFKISNKEKTHFNK